MNETVFLNISQISEVHKKDVFVSDIADVYCSNASLCSRVKAIKVKTIHSEDDKRYVGNVLDIVKKIADIDPNIQVNNVGEVDFIMDYQKQKAPNYVWPWIKTIAVCFICFCGAGFAIMTFNNDASVTDVFKEVYQLVVGQEAEGTTIIELGYSIGLALGIIVFFNHFAHLKINTDPTPIEVEMRLYEDNINKTLIQNDGREESGIDVT